MPRKTFIKDALELNLFFLRIMKEHLFFIKLSLAPKNETYINMANNLYNEFNKLLSETIDYANGIVTLKEQFASPYTLRAEMKTEFLSGASIDTNLTKRELELNKEKSFDVNDLELKVKELNKTIILNLNKVISFKTEILNQFRNCQIFIFNYPSLIEHTLNEAIMYAQMLININDEKNQPNHMYYIIQTESFWDHIMADHGKFIDGYLDPSEVELKKKALDISNRFTTLKNKISNAKSIDEVRLLTKDTISLTKHTKEFKETATKGILDCKIESIINPLLSDHLIREAAFYLETLEKFIKDIPK